MNRPALSSLHRLLARGKNRPRVALHAALLHGGQASVYESALVHMKGEKEAKKCRARIELHRRLEALALHTLSRCGRPPLSIEA